MLGDIYASLSWLPKPPSDFRQRCRALLESEMVEWHDVTRLAGYSLDDGQLRHLSTVVERHGPQAQKPPLTRFRLGVVGNGTLESLAPALIASALRHGVLLECVIADFGQTAQEALSADSALNGAELDAVLIALDYRGLPLSSSVPGGQASAAAVEESLRFVKTLRDGFRQHGGASCIVQTIAPPPEPIFGSLDCAITSSPRALCTAYNAALVESLSGTGDVLLDTASIAEIVGLENWYSPTLWHLGKFPFDARLVPLYADFVARLVGALRGKSRRCLILDLDNTIWGGVVGDDGVHGLVLGQGDPTGEAFLEVQRVALTLRDRGILLAVCSKNEDAIARSVFADHPEMLLNERHIAVFQANWNDKASNIAAIADELGLGLDTMVFLDDNPAERALVREALPKVAVPELPRNPALYARTLMAAGYFESATFSDEDRRRTDLYQHNAKRVALKREAADLESYLASLQMKLVLRHFDTQGRARIAQLINKSNQFNLSTRRYTENEVAEIERDPRCFTIQARLIDTFGDNGIISVVICRGAADLGWEIDTWLMSCRVLGRGVERMMLRIILEHARLRGIKRLRGTFVPTQRNAIVQDHYERLGFTQLSKEPNGTTTWELDSTAEVAAPLMTVDSAGLSYGSGERRFQSDRVAPNGGKPSVS